MDGYELLEKLKELIDSHTANGMDCNVHQAGHKDDYFNLFSIAHNSRWFEASARPRLTGDAIRTHFYDGWLAKDNDINRKRGNKLQAVLEMWDEWHYALEKYGVPSENE
jgi:hypothetical protein